VNARWRWFTVRRLERAFIVSVEHEYRYYHTMYLFHMLSLLQLLAGKKLHAVSP